MQYKQQINKRKQNEKWKILMSSGQHAQKQKMAQVNNNVIIIIGVIRQLQTEQNRIWCNKLNY